MPSPLPWIAAATLLAVAAGAAADPPRADALVVVELFTSQGCSSCPPADRLLSGLLDRPAVLPLAYHVDYWNRLGWTDPFSSPAWSRRQEAYARAFGTGRVYTPQLVIAGVSECVGSDAGRVEAELRRAGRAPAGVAVELARRRLGPGAWRLEVAARRTSGAGGPVLDAMLAVYENGLRTPVPRGENAGRTLRHDFVVRRLERVFTLPAASATGEGSLDVRLEPGWRAEEVGVVAFLQDPATLAIVGAATLRPPAGSGPP
jgi:hypothetical protein